MVIILSRKPRQRSPYKKWRQLSLKQRDYVINEAYEAYKTERNQLNRPLSKDEKYTLIKKIKLRCWIPLNALKPKMMDAFSHQENIIERDSKKQK